MLAEALQRNGRALDNHRQATVHSAGLAALASLFLLFNGLIEITIAVAATAARHQPTSTTGHPVLDWLQAAAALLGSGLAAGWAVRSIVPKTGYFAQVSHDRAFLQR